MSQVDRTHRSPNFNERPFGVIVDTVVMHATESDSAMQDVHWLCSNLAKASAHNVIDRDGTVYELVAPEKRAWHAGVSEFDGKSDVNSYSLGIELANRGDGEPYPDAQLGIAAILVAGYIRKWPAITVERITTHKAIALPPGRKSDPQAPFDIEVFRDLVRQELAG